MRGVQRCAAALICLAFGGGSFAQASGDGNICEANNEYDELAHTLLQTRLELRKALPGETRSDFANRSNPSISPPVPRTILASSVGRRNNDSSYPVDSLWGPSVKKGTLQRRLAQHQRQDDTHKQGSVNKHLSLPLTHFFVIGIFLALVCPLLCLLRQLDQGGQHGRTTEDGHGNASAIKAPALEVDHMGPRCLHHRISVRAKSDPTGIALIDGDMRETFGQFQASSLYVARHLVQDRGVIPKSGTPVCVCAEGNHMMHAILGIVHTGNPYVPLPPDLPSSTLAFIVANANIRVVLADPSSLLPGGVWNGRVEASPAHVLVSSLMEEWEPSWEVTGQDLAYMLYTSGSTGKPKGVLAAHESYYNRLAWMWKAYPAAAGEVGIQKTATVWIDHVWEVFGILGSGTPLVLAPPQARKNPIQLINLCRQHGVSRLTLVPSLLRVMVEALGNNLASELPCLRFWITSGENLPTDLLRVMLKAAAPGSILLNLYGTTEVAGDVTWAAYDAGSALPDSKVVPIGVAIPPNVIHLLDPDTLQHVSPGEPGEIFVEGPHLALGYHERPEENEARFVKLPNLGIERAFRTGDFGKTNQSQEIQYLGRKDQQVKVHGQRVEILQVEFELGEALATCITDSNEANHDVKPACAVEAIPSESNLGSYRLLAFVEMVGTETDVRCIDDSMQKMLRQHMLKALLPAHIPEAFVGLNALPRLVNGKLDRMALKNIALGLLLPEQEELSSLGVMQKMARDSSQDMETIYRCYTFWIFGVIVSHWFECSTDGSGNGCSKLIRLGVSPWVELFFRTISAEQTLFGFFMLAAWQDSAGKLIKLGVKDVILVFLIVAGTLAGWFIGWLVKHDGMASLVVQARSPHHLWYLRMLVWARVSTHTFQSVGLPSALQVVLQVAITLWGPQLLLDHEPVDSTEKPVRPFYYNCMHWYCVVYTIAFHFARPIVEIARPKVHRLGLGPYCAMLTFGLTMALGAVWSTVRPINFMLNWIIDFAHYPVFWLLAELLVPLSLSVGVVFSMAWCPVSLRWSGSATLGTYLTHWWVSWTLSDPILRRAHNYSSMVQLFLVAAWPSFFVMVLGPCLHWLLFGFPASLFHRAHKTVRQLDVLGPWYPSSPQGHAEQSTGCP